MTPEQEAFERGFLKGFQEGRKTYNPYPNTLPRVNDIPPGIIWNDGMHGPSCIGDVNVLNCDAAVDNYNADRLRSD